MRRLLIALGILLLSAGVSAQAATPPLLILKHGGIYAISPQDGAIVETLVAPPDYYADLADAAFDPVTLFSAEWMSPDGEFLAYRVLSVHDPIQAGGDRVYTHSFFLLNLVEGGDPIPVTLADESAFRVTVESVAWSNDGAHLYVLITSQTPRQNDPVWALLMFERGAWQTPLEVPLDPPGYADARTIFAADENVVVWDRGVQGPHYNFRTFDRTGAQVSIVPFDTTISPTEDVNLYINTAFNPVETENGTEFVFVNSYGGSDEVEYAVHFFPLLLREVEPGYFPALISRTASESSVRVSLSLSSGDVASLLLRDAQSGYLDYIESVPLYAFGILGDSIGSTITLSPDGQTVAFLHNDLISLWHDGITVSLNVSAQVIAWQSPLFTLVYDPTYLIG